MTGLGVIDKIRKSRPKPLQDRLRQGKRRSLREILEDRRRRRLGLDDDSEADPVVEAKTMTEEQAPVESAKEKAPALKRTERTLPPLPPPPDPEPESKEEKKKRPSL